MLSFREMNLKNQKIKNFWVNNLIKLDKNLNDLFSQRKDVYNYAARIHVGAETYDRLDKADKKKLRKNFKTVEENCRLG